MSNELLRDVHGAYRESQSKYTYFVLAAGARTVWCGEALPALRARVFPDGSIEDRQALD